MLVIVLLALPIPGIAEDIDDGGFGFIDTKSGASATLSPSSKRLIIAEGAIAVSFCDADAAMACFSSEYISFAIPENASSAESWVNLDRVYCVARRFPDAFGELGASGSILIYSRIGSSCEELRPFDQIAIYSKSAGLRFLERKFENGGYLELWAVDLEGFAAGWIK